jgi:glycerol uptake facilitator protein
MIGELFAEFFGTLVLMLFGLGVNASTTLFASGVPGEVVKGGFTNVNFAWGLGVTMGIFVAGRISGAHLNPAVTIALAAWRDFPWRKVVPYSLAQIAAAFTAAALVFWNYLPAFHSFDPGLEKTAGIFSTSPAFPTVPFSGLLDQAIGTALLMICILAITDDRNQPPGANLGAPMVGLVVVAIGMSFGTMHGYAINPARDFGPRLFTVVAGFKNNGLTDGNLFWIPIVGPILGGILGSAAYDYAIRRFLPERI